MDFVDLSVRGLGSISWVMPVVGRWELSCCGESLFRCEEIRGFLCATWGRGYEWREGMLGFAFRYCSLVALWGGEEMS